MSPLPRFTPSTSRVSQTGAISILAAAGLTAVLASALLIVDLGSMFSVKRQLQTVADTAALSAVNDLSNASAIAGQIAGLNGFSVPGDKHNELQTLTGSYDGATGSFSTTVPFAQQNAVQITVTTQQPYFFMVGTRTVTATATATREDIAGISVGSGLLEFNSENSPLLDAVLGKLLNTSLSLNAVSYNGLVNTNLRLIDLVKADADIGTVDELLTTEMSMGELINLMATALDHSDTLDAHAAAGVLRDIALNVPGNLKLKLGDLIKLSLANPEAAGNAQINVLQLLTMSAQIANGEHFLEVPVAGINVPGLASLKLTFFLIEMPSIAIGPAGQDADGNWRTQAHTAQLRLKLDLGIIGLLNLPIYIEAAAGDAHLSAISCRSPRDDSVVTVGANSSMLRAYIGDVTQGEMTDRTKPAEVTAADILNVELLGLHVASVTASSEVFLPSGSAELEFNGPFDGQNTKPISGISTSGLIQSLSNNLHLGTKLLGSTLPIGGVLDAALSLAASLSKPVLEILDALLNPVLEALGIKLGYADVAVFHLSCGVPRLVR